MEVITFRNVISLLHSLGKVSIPERSLEFGDRRAMGFPGGPVVKNLSAIAGGHKSGKIPCATEQLTSSATATGFRLPGACALQQGKQPQ